MPSSIKIWNDVQNYRMWSEQPTTSSQYQFALNNHEIESYAMNNFCFWSNSNHDTKFDNQKQRYLVENYNDCCEEIKEVNIGYNKDRLTKFKSIASDTNKFINSETINDEESNPLISKTVEEVLQSQIISNNIRSGPNFGRSKRRLYHLRQDVVVKIIFRSMRKYYLKDFKAFFDFTKCSSYNWNKFKAAKMERGLGRYF